MIYSPAKRAQLTSSWYPGVVTSSSFTMMRFNKGKVTNLINGFVGIKLLSYTHLEVKEKEYTSDT